MGFQIAYVCYSHLARGNTPFLFLERIILWIPLRLFKISAPAEAFPELILVPLNLLIPWGNFPRPRAKKWSVNIKQTPKTKIIWKHALVTVTNTFSWETHEFQGLKNLFHVTQVLSWVVKCNAGFDKCPTDIQDTTRRKARTKALWQIQHAWLQQGFTAR